MEGVNSPIFYKYDLEKLFLTANLNKRNNDINNKNNSNNNNNNDNNNN